MGAMLQPDLLATIQNQNSESTSVQIDCNLFHDSRFQIPSPSVMYKNLAIISCEKWAVTEKIIKMCYSKKVVHN